MVAALSSKQLNEPVGEGGALSGLDTRLLEYAAMKMSPEEMSNQLAGAVDPARCAQRVREILRSQDWLSVVEQQAILMLDMYELRNILFDKVRENDVVTYNDNGDEVWSMQDPRWSANLIRLMKEFRAMLDATKAEVDKNKGNIRRAHADLMFGAIDLAFERLTFEIEKEINSLPIGNDARELAWLDFSITATSPDRASFDAAWSAVVVGIKPLLPSRAKMISIMEHALPPAIEAIENKVIE